MSPVEQAVDTYIRTAQERDRDKRAALLAQCWADDGRLVTRNGVIQGHAQMLAMLDRFHADPENAGIRVLAIDARGTSFRFRALTDRRDGTSLEVFDAGEIDADGRIKVVLTFAGPFA